MRIDFKQILRYLVSGLLGLGTNTGVFSFFHYIVGVHYVLASIIGFCSGVLVSFVCQKFFTFENRDEGRTRKQFVLHLTLLLFNLLATTLMIILLVEVVLLSKTLSVVVSSGVASIWSFVVYKKFVFHKIEEHV